MKIDFAKKYVLAVSLCILLLLLAGCGVFKGEQTLDQIDAPPEETELTDDLDNIPDGSEDVERDPEEEGTEIDEESTESIEEEESATSEIVTRTLYLLDQNGLVVPQELQIPSPQSNAVAKQVLEYLVQDGPVTAMLPSGFQAVLPAGTEIIDLNLEADGTLVVNVSEEFASYQPENEQKILESMTHTLTQFDNVERMKLWIDGEEQNTMPVNGTPISEGYSRANGINIHQVHGVDLMESEAATLYFPMQGNEMVYFVPVTQHVPMNEENKLQSVVQALMEGPSFELPLEHYINTGAQLVSEPNLEDGVLSVNFNENILSNSAKSMIADEVMQSIVLTLTEQEGVDAVEVSVENHEEVISEDGQTYTEPVSKEMISPSESI
ncbi:GerMN domain-containing protein [Gracilibacillus sp. S3-1-1]|uniref:GerMN domain-containing protein n=1 Tax=Gracilibacillus pellucidus TaxID=3095368 RepID=A0ACC6M6S3_9BACI|nr:GerMN domain-containing protein [Gracilibacillus sp. S3-1-1]MDX8046601.1 GerMN domain-containing protein [Gracilibacillus sp. S3-1-1]